MVKDRFNDNWDNLSAAAGRSIAFVRTFPGVDAQRQAWQHGVKVAGPTVHLVTGELDGGPIILQSAIPVQDDDTPDTLAERILVEEHRIYPEAVQLVLDGGWTIDGRRFRRGEHR